MSGGFERGGKDNEIGYLRQGCLYGMLDAGVHVSQPGAFQGVQPLMQGLGAVNGSVAVMDALHMPRR